jgi:hypothetical protein
LDFPSFKVSATVLKAFNWLSVVAHLDTSDLTVGPDATAMASNVSAEYAGEVQMRTLADLPCGRLA